MTGTTGSTNSTGITSSNSPSPHNNNNNNNNNLSFMEKLQNDFNYGLPFDMSLYNSNQSKLTSMGVSLDEAMEALLITENKSVDLAIEMLFTYDMATRRRKREEAIERLGRGKLMGMNTNGSPNETADTLAQQLQMTKKLLEAERVLRIKSETEKKLQMDQNTRNLYKEYIRGMTTEEGNQLRAYRDKLHISEQDHMQIVNELGLTPERLEKLSRTDKKAETECVVCLDRPKDHVVDPCRHLCLCSQCAKTFPKTLTRCPICSRKISKIQKVFT